MGNHLALASPTFTRAMMFYKTDGFAPHPFEIDATPRLRIAAVLQYVHDQSLRGDYRFHGRRIHSGLSDRLPALRGSEKACRRADTPRKERRSCTGRNLRTESLHGAGTHSHVGKSPCPGAPIEWVTTSRPCFVDSLLNALIVSVNIA